jgi:hypothetical protein
VGSGNKLYFYDIVNVLSIKMNPCARYFYCLLLSALISTSGCKKNKALTSNQKTDFRDLLVGNYYCSVHQWTQSGGGPLPTDTLRVYDSITGYATITVAKGTNSDTAIVVNGYTSTALITPVDSSVIQYYEPPATFFAGFYDHGDSIAYYSGTIDHWANGSGTSYLGHKVR